jgi:hypothetical protein
MSQPLVIIKDTTPLSFRFTYSSSTLTDEVSQDYNTMYLARQGYANLKENDVTIVATYGQIYRADDFRGRFMIN